MVRFEIPPLPYRSILEAELIYPFLYSQPLSSSPKYVAALLSRLLELLSDLLSFTQMFKARLLDIELFEPSSVALIFDVIRQAAEKLESATLDPTHTIALHSQLLRSLLRSTPRPSPSRFPSSSNHQATFPPPLPTHSLAPPLPTLHSTDPSWPFLSSTSRLPGPHQASTPNTVDAGMDGGIGSSTVTSSFVDLHFVEEGTYSNFSWLEGGMLENIDIGALDFTLFDFRPPN